jgi:hypothetical protein
MGREKRARLKRWSKNTQRTCRCSYHHESSYSGRSKSLQQATDATLTTTVKESAWACEGIHDMAIMMQCNLSKLSGIRIPTHTYMVQVIYLLGKFQCWLTWQTQDMGELHKIKWSGKPYLVIPNYPICCLLDEMQIITSLHDARCKQIYEWHIQILYIFLNNFHIKHILFWVIV